MNLFQFVDSEVLPLIPYPLQVFLDACEIQKRSLFNLNNAKKIVKKYAELIHQAQQADGRKEAVGLIHKAAKLKTKFDNYEMM